MKYDYIRVLQISIVTFYALFTNSVLPYFACLIITALPSYRSLVSTAVLMISIVSCLFFDTEYLILNLAVTLVIGLAQLMQFDYEKLKINVYVTPVLIFMLSLVSMTQSDLLRNYHLAVFCLVLLLTYWKIPFWVLMIIRISALVEGLTLFMAQFGQMDNVSKEMAESLSEFGMNPWWHYVGFIGICLTCDMMMYGIKAEAES